MPTKAEVRLAIRDRLKRLSDKDRSIESRVIVKRLAERLSDEPKIIGAYLPYNDEPDIRPLLTDLLSHGWTICIPATLRRGMAFKKIISLSDIKPDPVTGIPDPVNGTEIDESTIAAMIVPGRAFTQTCDRMGRGNGGYDYWIEAQRKRNPATTMIGVCFDCQILPSVPMDLHDQKVDSVVTSSRAYEGC